MNRYVTVDLETGRVVVDSVGQPVYSEQAPGATAKPRDSLEELRDQIDKSKRALMDEIRALRGGVPRSVGSALTLSIGQVTALQGALNLLDQIGRCNMPSTEQAREVAATVRREFYL